MIWHLVLLQRQSLKLAHCSSWLLLALHKLYLKEMHALWWSLPLKFLWWETKELQGSWENRKVHWIYVFDKSCAWIYWKNIINAIIRFNILDQQEGKYESRHLNTYICSPAAKCICLLLTSQKRLLSQGTGLSLPCPLPLQLLLSWEGSISSSTSHTALTIHPEQATLGRWVNPIPSVQGFPNLQLTTLAEHSETIIAQTPSHLFLKSCISERYRSLPVNMWQT